MSIRTAGWRALCVVIQTVEKGLKSLATRQKHRMVSEGWVQMREFAAGRVQVRVSPRLCALDSGPDTLFDVALFQVASLVVFESRFEACGWT
eukprot:3830881-Rhodomonas_salina.2